MLEEDLALANIALDLIGQSRALYAYAGDVEGKGRDEDALAYLRDVASYRNILMVELDKGDFALTIARQFFMSALMLPFWQKMSQSTDTVLAGIAGKAVKEVTYHLRHTSEWMIRRGDGTTESARRLRAAVADLWPYTGELFEMDGVDAKLVAEVVAIDSESVSQDFERTISSIFAQALLLQPARGWMQTGGRHGRQTEHLGHILSRLQYLQRAYPGASW